MEQVTGLTQSDCTDANGNFTIGALPTGSYTVEFDDISSAGYLTQWWNGAVTAATATPIAVTQSQTTPGINATLVLGGRITGTVTDASTQQPIADICPAAFDGDNDLGQTSCTDSSGAYQIIGLPPGNYQVQFTDPNHIYSDQWWNGAADQTNATSIAVTGSGTMSGIDAAMHRGGSISGTVTVSGGVSPANVCMYVYRSPNLDFSVAYACANNAGAYAISGLSSGKYAVDFVDQFGQSIEWYNARFSAQTADLVEVTAGADTPDINLSLGSVSGTVVEAGTGKPLAGICANLFAASDVYNSIANACTDASGHYTIGYIPTGQYEVRFVDQDGPHISEWYNGKSSGSTGDLVRVDQGADTPNIDATLAIGGQITGHVVDASTHDPIQGVCVTVWEPDIFDYADVARCTDSAGMFQTGGLPTGDYQIDFVDGSGNYIGQWYDGQATQSTATSIHVTSGSTTSGIDAALVAGGAISGTVTDASTGDPIAGVCVQLVDAATDEYLDAFGCTDENGIYTSTGLRPGTYKVYFYPQGQYAGQWYNNKPDASSADPVTAVGGQATPGIDAALASGGTVSGTVTDTATGQPIAGICVQVSNASAFGGGCSDQTGQYTAGVPTGTYAVQFFDDSGPYLQQYYNNKQDAQSADPVSVVTGDDTGGIDAAMIKGATFSGQVRDSSTGFPVANICVQAVSTNSGSDTSGSNRCSGNDGRYTTSGVPAGTYKLDFTNFSGRYIEQWYQDAADQSAAQPVSATLGEDTGGLDATMVLGGVVTGTVTSSGKPIPDICVTLYRSSDGSFGGNGGCTDAQGHYASAAVAAGSYRVGFQSNTGTYAPQFYNGKPDLASADDVVVSAGDVKADIDASLEKIVGSVSGTITDEKTGAPIANACVYLYQVNGNYSGIGTCDGADGTYSITDLPAGSYQVAFFDPSGTHETRWWNGQATQQGGTVISSPGASTGVDAALPPITTIEGTVTDASTNEPLADVCAYLYSAGTATSVAAACSGNDGRIALQGMNAGSYQLAFADSTGTHVTQWYHGAVSQQTAQTITITDGDIVTAEDAAMAPITTVTGTAVDAKTTEPLAGVCAYLYPSGSDSSAAASCSGADGRIALQGMPPGTYQLAFTDSTGLHATQWYTASTTRTGATSLDLGDGTIVGNADAALHPITTVVSTVTAEESGQPLANVCAYLYPVGSPTSAAAGCSGADGRIALQGMPPGDYQLAFADASGQRVTEWYGGSYQRNSASIIPLGDGDQKLDADVQMDLLGGISGTVSDGSGPLADICVYADDLSGNYSGVGACTDSSGQYTLSGLPSGDYKLGFYPPGQPSPTVYWYSGKSDESAADPVQVQSGAATSGVDETIPAP